MARTQSMTHGSQANLWLQSRSFDLIFVTGGAIFTLLVAALAFQTPRLLPIFFWMWIVLFEGSHFWATLSRTYFDRDFRSKHKPLLWGSMLFFALPLACVIVDQYQQQVSTMLLYGFFIFTWSLFHNLRQHYGFLSIYGRKAGVSEFDRDRLKQVLYLGVGACQAYFLLNFKMPGVFSLNGLQDPNWMFLSSVLPLVLFALAVIWFALQVWEHRHRYGPKLWPSAYYIGICLVFYGIMFFYIAPQDRFVQSLGGGETLMLIAIMNSLFHNIQYHAIVWYYGQKRYQDPHGSEKFGTAKLLNGQTLNYLVFALLAGAIFGTITWFVGDWPDWSGSWDQVGAHSWAYVVFFGIIGHHFFMDQKIWRPSKQKDLKSYLKVQ
ncbi:hypothetical protein [Pseudobacteriovorax antillogorgiicola]|uniref:Uncharacterized protein n=1 Tax=Pseudobacteriovorax antillogorgiicola TaxID=1513793 RepID=A0A1Y6BWZ8_9BACT|nr:hypothetical protein [Pseudobacteriovorax antillogorgiicola]TCS53144.1 hypothetical protein EDD56_108195 [Pseudobacteriovorax antillogorgiicola]SMF25246.1 hypothetical protein SAMN06296036_10851 [Pseudobacteriovorax antillogorgiicola]